MTSSAHHGPALLERLDLDRIDALVRRQQRNREVHTPVISLYRWWARRPHALIGALLDAALEDAGAPLVCSDPFSGGGTVAVEAARRGMGVYAQDLHPWASTGLSVALDGLAPDEVAQAGRRWLAELDGLRDELYTARCPVHGAEAESLTTFWVRLARCPECERRVHLFPYSLITLASRQRDETHGFFGCGACGHVTRSGMSAERRRCGRCGMGLADTRTALLGDRQIRCPHRGCAHSFDAFSQSPVWEVVLVQRLCQSQDGPVVHLTPPEDEDRTQARRGTTELPFALKEKIPTGVETRTLRRGRMETWKDLYPPRQLRVMLEANAALERLPVSAKLRTRLRLALCGSAEMAGWSSRWDRWYPKSFEAIANHRYSLTGLAVETNLLAERGRGTLPRRLAHSVKAARWAHDGQLPVAQHRSAAGPRGTGRHVVAYGSSARQLPDQDSVDLVVTDPPYFDDVQYAELAGLFLAWARALKLIPARVKLDLGGEVVANSARGIGAEEYRRLLTDVLSETRRTLKADGRMVLTFHNSDGRAWWALGRALADAGFVIRALAVARAENDRDHAKRGRRAFSRDLIIESAVADVALKRRLEPRVIGRRPFDAETAELVAAGLAMGDVASDGGDATAFRDAFWRRLGYRGGGHIRLAGSGAAS
jgi:putative DNA methylase